MQCQDQKEGTCSLQPIPRDWARLIHKLRWIGLEAEAKRLEFAVGTLQPEKRGTYPSDRSTPTRLSVREVSVPRR